jgi:probable blue pigment (indigoidine) exporter
MNASRHRTALVQNLGAIVTWSVAPSMIRWVSAWFPVNLQNSVRYLVSLVVLWPLILLSADRARRAEYGALLRRHAPRILVIAVTNYAFQVCYTFSLFFVTPSVMTLVSQTQVLFGVLFAVLFFGDERRFVRGPAFVVGLAAALAGVALVVAGGPSFGTAEFGAGVLLVVGSAASWALLGALLRLWLPDMPPLLSLASVFTLVTPAFVLTYVAVHGGAPIPAAPPLAWLVLVASGLLAIGLGHSLFYRAVPVLGISVSTSLNLLTPLLASVVSYLVYGERLTAVQLAGAAVLLGGSWLVIRARFRARPAAAVAGAARQE